jgi:glycosyltransferase involved in cell wall biosynthesis
VIRILKNESLRASMADAGPRWTAERYSRQRMTDDYFRFFQSLTAMPKSAIIQGRVL